MTTIAIRGQLVAADSAATCNGLLVGSMRKLARSPDGDVVACSGAALAVAAMLRWVEDGMDGSPGVSDDDIHALLVRPDGTVFEVGGDGTPVQIDAPFHAGGTGRQIAIGAMAAGKSAEEAVQIACQWHGGSREPVQVMRLGE